MAKRTSAQRVEAWIRRSWENPEGYRDVLGWLWSGLPHTGGGFLSPAAILSIRPEVVGPGLWFLTQHLRGTTTVLAGGPKFRVLARNRLAGPDGSDRSLASSLPYAVAAVRGSLLIRTAGELVCVRDFETAARPYPCLLRTCARGAVREPA